MSHRAWWMAAVAGTVCSVASAQSHVVNIAADGAFQALLNSPSATGDYLDLDGDALNCGVAPFDQLAPFSTPPGSGPTEYFSVQVRYLSTFALNDGLLDEWISYSQGFATGANCVEICATAAASAFYNRTQYLSNGVPMGGLANLGNPGAAPLRSNTLGTYLPSYAPPNTPAPGGIQVDIAAMGTRLPWATKQAPGAPSPFRLPLQAGYGFNPRTSVTKAGLATGGGAQYQPRSLAPLDLNTFAPGPNTVYETPLFFDVLAPVVNLGTGLQQMNATNLRHLNATGRLISGENLMMVSCGGKTYPHFAFNLCMGLDPSFGVGENIGISSVASNENLLGPSFIPSNKLSISSIETSIINHRLGIGYTGAGRAVTGSAWLTAGRLEILAIRNDLAGGLLFVRPTASAVFNNCTPDSWRFLNFGSIATVGDPRSAPVQFGGNPLNTNPDVRNPYAAGYVNNLFQSIAASTGVPPPPVATCPGHVATAVYGLPEGLPCLPDPNDPTNFIINPLFSIPYQTFALTITPFSHPGFASFGTATLNGRVPTRQVLAGTYSDAALVPAGNQYVTQGGPTLAYGATSTAMTRNRISGDFNGDGFRNLNDATEMMRAYCQRIGCGPAWVAPNGSGPIFPAPGTDACIEILGDFNGDGSFTQADIRYWCDGLAIDPGTGLLDRKAGFTAVDIAWFNITGNSNFFGTVGWSAPGDSRGDMAGGPGVTRGFAPIGHDGIINATDITYINAQRTAPCVTGPSADWFNTAEAHCFDLSADVGGTLVVLAARGGGTGGAERGSVNDLAVNSSDIYEMVYDILNTRYGDVDLDGDVDLTDRVICQANQGFPGGWALGDINSDGVVNGADLAIINAALCPGNADGSAGVGFSDITAALTNFGAVYSPEPPGPGDANGDGVVDFADITSALTNFGTTCP